jgi:hypothetical protein
MRASELTRSRISISPDTGQPPYHCWSGSIQKAGHTPLPPAISKALPLESLVDGARVTGVCTGCACALAHRQHTHNTHKKHSYPQRETEGHTHRQTHTHTHMCTQRMNMSGGEEPKRTGARETLRGQLPLSQTHTALDMNSTHRKVEGEAEKRGSLPGTDEVMNEVENITSTCRTAYLQGAAYGPPRECRQVRQSV